MVDGMPLMPWWHADNWGTLQVRHVHTYNEPSSNLHTLSYVGVIRRSVPKLQNTGTELHILPTLLLPLTSK
jgi:hypothetical protein